MAKRGTLLGAGLLLGLAGGWFLGMRQGWRPVVDLQRKVNRAFFNPRMLELANQPGGPAAIIHHTGRSSGRPYRTPVGAVAIDGGYVVAAVYGPDTDWIRNLLSGGPAQIEVAGHRSDIREARLVPIGEVSEAFSNGDRLAHRLFAIEDAVQLWTDTVAKP
jgi:deazaflavin-dependent oxidoreductase (nitroreductase family)